VSNPQAAIVGIGESRAGKVPDRSALQLQADAAQAALADAGLRMADIDGLLTTPVRVEHWNMPCGVVAHHLGIHPSYIATVDLAGASGTAMIHQAALAVASGQCSTVLCVAGQNLLSHGSRAKAVKSMAEGGSAHPQFEVPRPAGAVALCAGGAASYAVRHDVRAACRSRGGDTASREPQSERAQARTDHGR
jgi:acetyl-CoA acetyltransferase